MDPRVREGDGMSRVALPKIIPDSNARTRPLLRIRAPATFVHPAHQEFIFSKVLGVREDDGLLPDQSLRTTRRRSCSLMTCASYCTSVELGAFFSLQVQQNRRTRASTSPVSRSHCLRTRSVCGARVVDAPRHAAAAN